MIDLIAWLIDQIREYKYLKNKKNVIGSNVPAPEWRAKRGGEYW